MTTPISRLRLLAPAALLLTLLLSAAHTPRAFAGRPFPPPGAVRAESPPNFLVIVADDLGVEMLEMYRLILLDERPAGCAGDPDCAPDPPATPNLQELREQGILFANAFTNPVCSPTRAQLLTGLHAFRNGMGMIADDRTVGDPDNPPWDDARGIHFATKPLPLAIPRRSAAVGKWHLLAIEPSGDYRMDHPTDHTSVESDDHSCGAKEYMGAGFDYYAGSPLNLSAPLINHPEYIGDYTNWQKQFDPTTLVDNYCVYATTDTINDAVALIDPGITLKCANPNFAPCDPSVNANIPTCDDFDLPNGLPATPWLLYVSLNAPHRPFHYPPERLCPALKDPNDPNYDSNLDPNDYFCDDERPDPTELDPCNPDDAEELRAIHYLQTRMAIEAMDKELGRLLEKVNLGNTYVFFIGDNGTDEEAIAPKRLGDRLTFPVHKGRAKGTLYEGGIRVPLIVAGPSISPSGIGNAGATCAQLVSSVDLYSTICELAGKPDRPVDSVSFVPYLSDPTLSEPDAAVLREYIYAENFVRNFDAVCEVFPDDVDPFRRHFRTVRGLRYKLILHERPTNRTPRQGAIEFFDLEQDPFEQNNLAGVNSFADPDIPANLEAEYCALKCELVRLLGCDQLEPDDICDCDCP